MGKKEMVELAEKLALKDSFSLFKQHKGKDAFYFAFAPNDDTPVLLLQKKTAFDTTLFRTAARKHLEDEEVGAINLSQLYLGTIERAGEDIHLTVNESASRGTANPRAITTLVRQFKDVAGCSELGRATVSLSTLDERQQLSKEELGRVKGAVGNQQKAVTGRKKDLDKRGKKALSQALSSKKLYEKSRAAKLADVQATLVLTGGALDIPHDAVIEAKHEPGVKAEVLKATTLLKKHPSEGLGETWDLPAKSLVLVQEVDKTEYYYAELLNVEDKKVSIDAKKKGFILRKAVKKIQRYTPVDAPLFTKKPSVDDIAQGNLGDCYFLAGLLSAVDKNPDAIQQLLRDNGDGTVTVKLFGQEEGETLVPRYFKVAKTTMESDDGRSQHASALWVEMLEKAWAQLRSEKKDGSFSMLGNEKGTGYEAIPALTGTPTAAVKIAHSKHQTGTLIGDPKTYGVNEVEVNKSNSGALVIQLKTLGLTEEGATKVATLLLDQGFTRAEEVGQVLQRNALATASAGGIKISPELLEPSHKKTVWFGDVAKALKAVAKPPDHTRVVTLATSEAYKELVTRSRVTADEVEEFLARKEFASLGTEFLKKARSALKGKFGGPRMSGEYAESEIELWERLKTETGKDSILTVGTPESVGSRTDGEGKSAGEKISKGLAATHEYALLGIYEPREGEPYYVKPTSRGVPIKYAILRNPWNDQDSDEESPTTGRVYVAVRNEEGRIVAYKAEGGRRSEFLLELSDLAKRCDTLSVSKPVQARWGNVEKKRFQDAFNNLLDDVDDVDTVMRQGVPLRQALWESGQKYAARFGVDAALQWVTAKVNRYTGPKDDESEDPT
jgi:hypothetical protein